MFQASVDNVLGLSLATQNKMKTLGANLYGYRE